MRLRIIFTILFLSIGTISFSNDSISSIRVIKIAPLGFTNKARLSYEQSYNGHLSFGLYTSYTFRRLHFKEDNMIRSLKFEPFLRYYFSNKQLTGFYIQPMIKAGLFFVQENKIVASLSYNDNNELISYSTLSSQYHYDDINAPYSKSIFSFGGGLYLYQTFIGKSNRWSLDVNTGIQYWWFNSSAYKNGYSDTRTDLASGGFTVIRQTNYNYSKSKFRGISSGQEFFPTTYFTIGHRF